MRWLPASIRYTDAAIAYIRHPITSPRTIMPPIDEPPFRYMPRDNTSHAFAGYAYFRYAHAHAY